MLNNSQKLWITWGLLIWVNVLFSQERLIKPGDAIDILMAENEALSRTVMVKPDGTIDYPALQGMPVDGISLQRFQEILIAQLSRYLASTPLVFVKFSESYPIKVTVLGQVALPGMYQIANTVTLQGAIGAAGGLIAGAQLSKIKLIRMNGKNKTEQIVNLEQFYLNADPSVMPPLQDEDVIVVPGSPMTTGVKVLGSVERPGNYEVLFRANLLDVLFMAGGPTDDANLNAIKIGSILSRDTREVKINIKNILKSKSPQAIPMVVPGDVVYVPERKLTWGKTVAVLRDLATFATLYVIIRYRR